MTPPRQTFAVIPAAGRSRRMGTAKLLLEVGGRAIIDRVLDAWTASRVDEVVVVVRQDDDPLVRRCRMFDVHVVPTKRCPKTMRDTIELGLDYVSKQFRPAGGDAWLVSPADMPALSTKSIDCVISTHTTMPQRIVVPRVAGEGGHPIALPWSLVDAFRGLPASEGLNAMARRESAYAVDMDDAGTVLDVDTPADYKRCAAPHEK